MLAPLTAAEIYKYRDANGKVHFTDQPPEHVEAQVLEIEQPAKNDTPLPNAKRAEALFEQDKIDQEQRRLERIQEAKERQQEKDKLKLACEKAKSELVRMQQYRAQASSISSKRYYNERVEQAKAAEDEACKLSLFR